MKNNKLKSIALIEDNRVISRLWKKLLEKEHFHVEYFPRGDKAWEYLRENSVDIIISDIMIPGIDGLELCRKLRSKSKNENVPIVVISASASHENQHLAEEAGANAFFIKSRSSNTEILKKIHQLLSEASNG